MNGIKTQPRILLIEDSEFDATILLRELKGGGYEPVVRRVSTENEILEALKDPAWDLVISDDNLPTLDSSQALKIVRDAGLDLPFIIVSGRISDQTAVAAMKSGAQDYIIKGEWARLIPAIEREVREAEIREKSRRAEQTILETEERLRMAQKMEAIGQLASGVAHDFNNHLSVIFGWVHMILKENPSLAIVESVDEIKKAAVLSAELTKKLLVLSRKQILDPKVLNLNGLLLDLSKFLNRLMRDDIKIVNQLGTDLKNIKADPHQIEQVVMNLVINARDAMPEGGTITIETSNVWVDKSAVCNGDKLQQGPHVCLAVRDNGMGIAEQNLPKIFEPFFTTKGVNQGTGLGLSMVYGIVKQSGGHIGVESKVGQGTTFFIYLPAVDAAESPDFTTPPPGKPGGGERILLVDDDESVRRVAALILTQKGYRVLEAKNGMIALHLCETEKTPIDILVTDLRMPDMNGRRLAERAKKLRPDMKVLFISGYTDPDSLGSENIWDSLLMKPLTADNLSKKIRDVLDRPQAPFP